jgi:hypothetical protein
VNTIQHATHNKLNDASIPWDERLYRPGDVVSGILPLFREFFSLQEGKQNIKLAADIYGLVVNASVPDIYMLAFFFFDFLILD